MTNEVGSDGTTGQDTAGWAADRDALAAPHHTQPVEPTPAGKTPIDRGDVVISAVLLVIFVAAFITAGQWEPIAALFPKIVGGIGTALSAVFLVRSLLVPAGRDDVAGTEPADIGPLAAAQVAEEQVADQADSERTFFASLDRGDWLVSLAFVAGFFVSLYVLGLYITAVVFTVIYLKYQAKSSWRFAGIYAIVLTLAIYGLFGYALQLPVPEGLFGVSGL